MNGDGDVFDPVCAERADSDEDVDHVAPGCIEPDDARKLRNTFVVVVRQKGVHRLE